MLHKKPPYEKQLPAIDAQAAKPANSAKPMTKKEKAELAALDSVTVNTRPMSGNGAAGAITVIPHDDVEKKWDVVFADELPEEFTPQPELLQGILTADGMSVIYGATGSGKTFLMVDLACAVARGVEWMHRQTQQGLVIYLAAESPGSVMRRVQAYQKHHGVRIPDLAIVKNPIDFFQDNVDATAVVQLVQKIEKERGKKAVLVIADTLARISGDAQENGSDMSRVVRNVDVVRRCIEAHFSLVHHCGKNAANGARGWSGVRAACDTEIEVIDGVGGHVAEITKQRDLATLGDRIGFSLKSLELGLSYFGVPATTCVVEASDAPAKEVGKKLNSNGGQILEFLRQKTVGQRPSEIAKHFAQDFTRGTVYNQLEILVEKGLAHRTGFIYVAAKL
jgi:putative DNA primase/helicase